MNVMMMWICRSPPAGEKHIHIHVSNPFILRAKYLSVANYRVNVAPDHVDSLTRSTPASAVMELVWNSLDAGATEIRIQVHGNGIGGVTSIEVLDNGDGLRHDLAVSLFEHIGGSHKKQITVSPHGRIYHGKEGKGRYRALGIGSLVKMTSRFKSNGTVLQFNIELDKNSLGDVAISEPEVGPGEDGSGFKVQILNILPDTDASVLVKSAFEDRLKQELAAYHIRYPDFTVWIGSSKVSFAGLIKSEAHDRIIDKTSTTHHEFVIHVVEWNLAEPLRKTFFCSDGGIPYEESSLGFRTPYNVSIFIKSAYINDLKANNRLIGLDEVLKVTHEEAKKIGRAFSRKRQAEDAQYFIESLKAEGAYPYSGNPENIVEEAERQVFDILAWNIKEHLENFDDLEKSNKALTLNLVKVALETDSKQLRSILENVLKLPPEKVQELSDLLEKVTLTDVIDLANTVKNRLACLSGLTSIIFDREASADVLERRHLHRILIKELWVFGDQYLLGADDNDLKNVLKSHLKHLGRDDFEEMLSQDNEHLHGNIPDICLWQKYGKEYDGRYTNLVIELKKPTVRAGFDEVSQIQRYAQIVADDDRFDKLKTKWVFILLTRGHKDEIRGMVNPSDRPFGHIIKADNYDVFVYQWSAVLQTAKGKLDFLKERLNFQIESNHEGLDYLRKKHNQFLPASLQEIEVAQEPEAEQAV